MSRTIKLEGLSVAVNPRDIRLHFAGLRIPEGGITILGGERGEAYISFITLEDARRAIQLSGCPIKDSNVYVYSSSITEMESSLLKYNSAMFSRNGVPGDRDLDRRGSLTSRASVYLRITVTAGVTTTTSVRRYFDGLHIADIVAIKDNREFRNGAIVKFYNSNDASEGVRRHRYSKDVNVVWSNEKEWARYGGKAYFDGDNNSYSSRHDRIRHQSRSPDRHSHLSHRSSRSPRRHSRSPLKYSRSHYHYDMPPRTPIAHARTRRVHSPSPHVASRSPRRRSRSPQPVPDEHDPIYDGDFHVHLTNLSYSTKKQDLRKWLFNLVRDDHIKFLYDEKGWRTRECFVTLKNEKDYTQVLRLDKVTFNGRLLFISPISKANMRNYLTGRKALFSHHHTKGKCLYLRNFPTDVTKSDIQKFFAGFSLSDEDISLLCDRKGVGLGEVMVSFSSKEELERAEKLHRKKFKDREIPLRRIPEDKLESFLSANSVILMPEDPYDCVTQEDDLQEEECDQDRNTVDEGDQDNIPDEDSGFHQTDNTHEFVTQADDALDDSIVHVENAPSNESLEDAPSTKSMEDVPGTETVENVPGTETVENVPGTETVENVPGTETVENVPGTETVENVPGTEIVENVPGTETVETLPGTETMETLPGTESTSEENSTQVDGGETAIPEGAPSNDEGLWANVFVSDKNDPVSLENPLQ